MPSLSIKNAKMTCDHTTTPTPASISKQLDLRTDASANSKPREIRRFDFGNQFSRPQFMSFETVVSSERLEIGCPQGPALCFRRDLGFQCNRGCNRQRIMLLLCDVICIKVLDLMR